MKILQFCQLYPPAIYGGGEYLFFQFAKELVREGHEVSIITQKLQGTLAFEEIDGIKVYRVGKSVNYKGHLNMNIIDNLSFVFSSFRKGLEIAGSYDIIHSNTYAPSISARIVSKLLRIPLVISVFDVYSNKGFWKNWSKQKEINKKISFIGPLIEKLILKFKPNKFHTISNASFNDLISAGVNKKIISNIPCAIDLEEYKVKKTSIKNQFCFIGRHVFYKNIDVIIKAMPFIIKRNPLIKFIIAGDGPMKNIWEKLAVELKVNKNIIFTGRINHEEKLKLINESKFVVNPSVVEGFGIVLLESWALDKPVIVSDVPPLNELVNRKNGYLVNAYDVNAWADAINLMLKQKPKNLRKFAEKYDIRKITPLLIKLFQSIIA